MTATTPQVQPQPARAPGSPWPINDAALFLHVSTRHLHRLLDTNKVRSLRLGRRRLIPDSEVQRLAREGC
jgi:excisionase family DNA binding protein